MGDETPMTRLLEGDVGSGKTVVAAAALLAAVASGHQGAIMAPTEILAEQHLRTFTRILQPDREDDGPDGPWFQEAAPGYVVLNAPYMERPVRVALLTGSLKASEKSAVQAAIAAGEVDIAIGTHALLQQGVSFQRLGLAVIDEQHRFGVEQRATLREKGGSPHVLVMTATPIPRTLALTVYGDLDITVLNEMPPGRPSVKTYRVLPYRRQEAFDFVERKVARRAAGVHHLPAGRGVGVDRGEGGGAGVRAAVAGRLPGPAPGAAARPHARLREGSRDARLPRRRGGHTGLDGGR